MSYIALDRSTAVACADCARQNVVAFVVLDRLRQEHQLCWSCWRDVPLIKREGKRR